MKEGNVISERFLLNNERALRLFNGYAKDLPIIDYHNHLPPQEIAENKQFVNLTEIWLKGDHYKWRGMRTLGVDENLITGTASDKEKFMAWAEVVPSTIRNPLFHWTHMELKNPFGVNSFLNKDSAMSVYKHCNELLSQDEFSTQGLLNHYKVKMVGTTDDPCDDLKWHQQLLDSSFTAKVKPSFRPDKALMIEKTQQFKQYVQALSEVSGIQIKDIESLVAALKSRVEFFAAHGCSISDHGLAALPYSYVLTDAEKREFESFLKTDGSVYSNPDAFAGYILTELSKLYHEKGWVQQFHLGAIRNNNLGMFAKLGADAGYDSIGDYKHAERMSAFFGNLSLTDQLTKTIIYNLNPADNEVFAAMTGNFADGRMKGKMQFGSGWWFLDQKDGIEKQLNTLSNLGMVSNFVGMLTDSRSFLSYSRHEYFRRILCNLFGTEMENGQLPDDEEWMGKIISDICYYNAEAYFNLK
ncbi:glucuronate isomerase [Pedobacter frigoris]|uniref:Uronate isomerase n=1 Tax=Pedobacter frigoris TaxID=2571272 RepID=A0A4V6WN39_9SPHI|nr:glucuronate isomerase [Pedobacter frigoris]TKC06153.1 glucuronate isomerase [Pedobacter frigoris]